MSTAIHIFGVRCWWVATAGIRAGDKCLALLDTAAPAEVLSGLARQVDVGPPVDTGQLELGTPADSYLRSGTFSAEEMIDYWGEEAAATQRGGRFGFTRATGEMPSVLDQPGERAEFFRYEAERGHPGLSASDLAPL